MSARLALGVGVVVALGFGSASEEQVGAQSVVITVTTSADASNGTVSTVEGLLSNPGPDGVSLREALQATNNDPGQYTIRFALALDGTTISVGSTTDSPLPTLTGGGVTVDGDIDGDGRPDIGLANEIEQLSPCGKCAFTVSSSGNRLHALALQNYFDLGVFFEPLPGTSDQSYVNNVVSNLVMDEVGGGVNVDWEESDGTRWEGLTITGNAITAQKRGVNLDFRHSAGVRVQHLTVSSNTIRITDPSPALGFGVNLSTGSFVGSKENLLSDLLIADNVIEGRVEVAIRVSSGNNGGSANTVERVRIVGNRVDAGPLTTPLGQGVALLAGDGASVSPIAYPDDNVVRDVEISGNTLTDVMHGVFVMAGCCGAARNTLEGVRIMNNELMWSVAPSPDVIPVGVLVEGGLGATFGRISDLSIDANRMIWPTADANSTAIFLAGGDTGSAGQMTDVSITRNQVVNHPNGIILVGGLAGDDAAVTDNQIARVSVRENVVSGYRSWGVLAAGGYCPDCPTDSMLRNSVRGLSIEQNELSAGVGGASSGVEIVGGDADQGLVSENVVDGVTLGGNVIRGNMAGIRLAGGRGAGATRNRVTNVVVRESHLSENDEALRADDNVLGATGNLLEATLYTDLAAAQTVSPNPVVVRRNVTYDVRATNRGPFEAGNVAVTITLPAGAALVSATPSQGTCSGGGPVTCTLGSLHAGSSASVGVVVRPSSPGTISSSATVTSDAPDLDPGNNTATASSTVTPLYTDLTAAQTVVPNRVVVRRNVTYDVRAANRGPFEAENIAVTITLPAGAAVVSATPSQGTCSGGGPVTCALGSLDGGSSASVSLVARPSSPGTISSSATVTSDTPDLEPGNNTATASSTVDPLRLRASSVRAAPRRPKAGGRFSLAVRVASNVGAEPVVGAKVACRASVGKRVIRNLVRAFVNGLATCSWRVPARSGGKRLRGSMIVTKEDAKLRQHVTARIRK